MVQHISTAEIDLSIASGDTQSAWVAVRGNARLTKLMALECPAGGPVTTLSVHTRPLDGSGNGLPVIAADTMGENFALNITADGGIFPADALAPLAAQVDREWRLTLGSAAGVDLAIKLRLA